MTAVKPRQGLRDAKLSISNPVGESRGAAGKPPVLPGGRLQPGTQEVAWDVLVGEGSGFTELPFFSISVIFLT